jgi:hypothetical protein
LDKIFAIGYIFIIFAKNTLSIKLCK